MTRSLYQTDIVLWSEEQAQALRDAGTARLNTPTPIDWDNVAEEIETLGRSERSALRSRIGVIIEHLLKLAASPAAEPRRGWMTTVLAQRLEIERLLADSPSLRREIPRLITEETIRARRSVAHQFALFDGKPVISLDQLSITEDRILGDWFPHTAIRQP